MKRISIRVIMIKMFKVTSIYVGIQNFGYNIGKKGLFINFYNCNRRCNYCKANDDYYHINVGTGINCFTYTIDELLFIVSEFDIENVILTGGEPTIQDETELITFIKELKESGYYVTIETNAKKYSNALKFADYVIVSIKTYSAGFPYTDMDIINEIMMTCNWVVFTCLINNRKDFDFLAKNFLNYDVWCFLMNDEYDFSEYVSKFITNNNWRICLKLDRVLRVDWETTYLKYKNRDDEND